MSFLYQKEIVEGVWSCRKIIGIPVYRREDSPDGVIMRTYLLGLWKTKTGPGWKKWFLLGLQIFQKGSETYNEVQVQEKTKPEKYEQKEINNMDANITEDITKIYKELQKISNILNHDYAESANLRNLIQCQSLHRETFGPYKNAFKGKTVVLVASGPTAQYYHPLENVIHVGVNNACLLENVQLDYLFCHDFYMNEERRSAIINYKGNNCKKFFGRIPDNRMAACKKTPSAMHVRRCPRYLVDEAGASEYYVYDQFQDRIAYDIEREPLSASGIAFVALQFILHCHPDKIYLVGCDCSSGFFYESDIKFDNSYMIRRWNAFKEYIDELYPDIRITSINPVGLKGLFHDEYDEVYLIMNR